MSGSTRPSLCPARPRHNGWTAERQLAFLGALSLTRSVTRSAAAAGMSRKSAYRLRERRDGALFAARWDQILRRPCSPPEARAYARHEGYTSEPPRERRPFTPPASTS